MKAASAIAAKIEMLAGDKKFTEMRDLLPLLKKEIKEAVEYIKTFL